MKGLRFLEGTPPPEFRKESPSFLFNTAEHRLVQAQTDWISFHLLDETQKINEASIHFHLKEKLAESPFKAPFGSIEFSSAVPVQLLYDFMQRAEADIKGMGVKEIIVRHPPQCYQPDLAPITEALFINSGYCVLDAEINVSLDVTDKSFENKIDAWELRKLNQIRKAKFTFRELSIGSLREVYSFIETCRIERKQNLSMTFDELRETVTRCNEKFFLFGVYAGDDLVAAAIDIRVQKKILYNFYSAHKSEMDMLSPVVLLTEGIYLWCRKHEIGLLDLGTSALDRKPNFGLLDFKLRLGGTPSVRYTYKKELR